MLSITLLTKLIIYIMKKFVILLVLCILSTAVVSAAQQKQTATSTQKVEKVQVTPSSDKNPIVGEIRMSNGQTYQVHQGPRGGLYIWWKATKGKHQGEVIKRNLNKTEKEKVVFTNNNKKK